MKHVRTQLREYWRMLIDSIPDLKGSVDFDNEEVPKELDGVFIQVVMGDEAIVQIGLGGLSGRKNDRVLQAFVDIHSEDTKDAILKAEEHAATIEAKLASQPRMGGLSKNVSLRGYQIAKGNLGELPCARLRIEWAINYFTNERDATVPA